MFNYSKQSVWLTFLRGDSYIMIRNSFNMLFELSVRLEEEWSRTGRSLELVSRCSGLVVGEEWVGSCSGWSRSVSRWCRVGWSVVGIKCFQSGADLLGT